MIERPLVLFIIIISIFTFISYLDPASSNDFKLRHIMWWKLDLLQEGNLATWFSSILFMICGLSFTIIGWNNSKLFVFPIFFKYFFRFMSMVCYALSADEVVCIHQFFEKYIEKNIMHITSLPIQAIVYFLGLLAIPIILFSIIINIYIFYKIFLKIPKSKSKQYAWGFLSFALIGTLYIFLSNAAEGYLDYHHISHRFISCLEEVIELLVLFCFIKCNIIIAKSYDL